MLIGSNHSEFIGYLKYVQDEQDEDQILKWSLVAAGGVLLIILGAVAAVCIYRRRLSTRRFPNARFSHRSHNRNHSKKLRHAGRVHGIGAQGTRAVLRQGYMPTSLPSAVPPRPRNASESRPVHWIASSAGDARYPRYAVPHNRATRLVTSP